MSLPSRNPPSSEAEQRQLGIAVGVQCSLAVPPVLLLCHFSTVAPTPGTGDMTPSAQEVLAGRQALVRV